MRDEIDFEAALQAAIDGKTKPVGALGRIETLAAQVARVQGTLSPRISSCRLTIFAADHELAQEGVSAYPQAVTRQMVLNFLSGGAAANVMARALGVEVLVVDAGVAGEPVVHPALLSRRIGSGTRNAAAEPSMTEAELEEGLAAGERIGAESPGEAAAFGEMGIGNTSSATLVSAKIAGLALDCLIRRGTGVRGPALAHKLEVLRRAAARTEERLEARSALIEYGGFEVTMMAGAMIGAALARKVVIVDGFIATAAAIAAAAVRPEVRSALVFAHCSAEAGHRVLLEWLRADPLLSLDMRLGEGTGALLAWPMVKAAAAMLREMASFESAGVSRG